MSPRFRILAVLLTVAPRVIAAQDVTVPSLDWQTVRTRHFTVHYPRAAERWTLDMAARLDTVYGAVSALVGSAPAARVTVVVEDPNNASNGFALPFLNDPVIVLWPTPPDPTSGIGDNRGWADLLSVHEFAHIAHLTRPSRNPLQRFLTRLSPVRAGPLALKSPRWVIEGYATYVEGRITGTGRPHGVWRAAVLREWARMGKLPPYGALDRDPRYDGGAMAYLAGSAFLEWLAERRGDSSLVHLWRRMSARTDRTFDDAFAGVFGGLPADLYGRFTAEVTGRALEVERHVREAVHAAPDSGAGRTVQALDWTTGAPALSPDGSLIALSRSDRRGDSRIVVWTTADEPDTSAARDRARLLAQDPEDVPAIPWRPRPKRAIAVLDRRGGMPFAQPRFLPDGKHILVVRRTGLGNGLLREDLYVWDFATGALRRVTHDAAIRHADPSPDGRAAVADRCREGICDLVRVDLATGDVGVIAAGAPRLVFDRPRWSPDGARIAVAVHDGVRWRIALLDARAGDAVIPRFIGPDDGANRFDPAFLPGDTALVVTSDASGIPNLEVMSLETGAVRPLTLVTSAALRPDADPRTGDVYFLRLHPKGLDLAVVADTVSYERRFATDPSLAPAARTPVAREDTFPEAPVSAPRDYGSGPRRWIVLPALSAAAEGKAFGATIAGTDPVGRLTWTAGGMYGDRGTWRGGSIGAAWRGFSPVLSAAAFYAAEDPSRQHGGVAAPRALDLRYAGVDVHATLRRDYVSRVYRAGAGASAGMLDTPGPGHASRRLAYADLTGGVRQTSGPWAFSERARVLAAVGRTLDSGWVRGIATIGARVSRGGQALDAEASYGEVSGETPAIEQFVVGGTASPIVPDAVLSQRVVMPALPLAVGSGRRFASYRVALPRSGIEPYFWGASAGRTLDRWLEVVGLEGSFSTDGLWIARLPGVRFSGGVAYSLSAPVAHRTTLYLELRYVP